MGWIRLESAQKDYELCPFDAVTHLFGGGGGGGGWGGATNGVGNNGSWNGVNSGTNGSGSLSHKLDLYFVDYSLMPLFVQVLSR